MEEKRDTLQDYEYRQALEEEKLNNDTLGALKKILTTEEGVILFTYLFKNLDVTCVPEQDMIGDTLQEYLGFLRAGNSIFKLASNANSEVSAKILAQLERDRHADRLNRFRIENNR